ncbi:MAG: hypothetical protein M1826_001633 [Phylliscum demangeonii]|nr:MAG: hypothetical protein M1826_001633 [Phylliscum demangeonii]
MCQLTIRTHPCGHRVVRTHRACRHYDAEQEYCRALLDLSRPSSPSSSSNPSPHRLAPNRMCDRCLQLDFEQQADHALDEARYSVERARARARAAPSRAHDDAVSAACERARAALELIADQRRALAEWCQELVYKNE